MSEIDNPGSPLLASGVLAIAAGCVPTLMLGLTAGDWSLPYAALYAALALALGLVVALSGTQLGWVCWLLERRWRFLLLAGALALAIQALGQERTMQPIIFTVPFVFAALVYGPLRTAISGVFFLGLMALGLWLGGQRQPLDLLLPLAGYGVGMLVMAAFIQLARDHHAARLRADQLAAELVRERDALARLAAENARLAAEAQRLATLAERNRIARELHDTIAQGITATAMQLEAAGRSLERDVPRTRARLSRAQELARETLAEVRRSVWALAEPEVDGPGLPAALAEQARRFAERTGVPASYTHHGPPPALDPSAAAQALRIAQEALQNVEKHAHASQVQITTGSEPTGLRLQIADNGAGFDGNGDGPSSGAGFGLRSMRERARLVGGELQIESGPGSGTRVALFIPGADPGSAG